MANWVLNELLREIPADDDEAIAACPVPPGKLAGCSGSSRTGRSAARSPRTCSRRCIAPASRRATIVAREGLQQVADAGALGAVVDQVLAANPKVVEDWKGGKKAAMGFLVGQVMKSTEGKANPALVNRLLAEKLPKL